MTKAPCVAYAIPPTMQDAAAHSGKLPEPEVETQPAKIWLWDELGVDRPQDDDMNYGLAQGAAWCDYLLGLMDRVRNFEDVEAIVLRAPYRSPRGRIPFDVHTHTPEHLRDHSMFRLFQKLSGLEVIPYVGTPEREEDIPAALEQLSWMMEAGDYTTVVLDALILDDAEDRTVFDPSRFAVHYAEWGRQNGYRLLNEPCPFSELHGDRRLWLSNNGIGVFDLDHRWPSWRGRLEEGKCGPPTGQTQAVMVNCKGPAEKRLHKMTAGQKYMYLSGVAREQASWGIDTICVPVHAWSDALRRSLRETHVTYRNTDQGDSADHGDAPGT
jgi:hypothetical protein